MGFGHGRTCTLTVENALRMQPTYLKVVNGWVTRQDCEWAFSGVCRFAEGQTRIVWE